MKRQEGECRKKIRHPPSAFYSFSILLFIIRISKNTMTAATAAVAAPSTAMSAAAFSLIFYELSD